MKACIDCKHYGAAGDDGDSCCYHEESQQFDVIYGHYPGSPARSRQNKDICGPDAKLFEPKPVRKSLFEKIQSIFS